MDKLKAVGFSGNLLAFIFNLVSSRELEANSGWLDLKDLEIEPKNVNWVSSIKEGQLMETGRSRYRVNRFLLSNQLHF
jgi:hypothetical protein